jgi:hypothetical protein
MLWCHVYFTYSLQSVESNPPFSNYRENWKGAESRGYRRRGVNLYRVRYRMEMSRLPSASGDKRFADGNKTWNLHWALVCCLALPPASYHGWRSLYSLLAGFRTSIYPQAAASTAFRYRKVDLMPIWQVVHGTCCDKDCYVAILIPVSSWNGGYRAALDLFWNRIDTTFAI